jgi:hypothetical protein
VARLRILEVRVDRRAGRVAAAVSLGYDGGTATGQIDRPATEAEAPHVAAEATLEALRQIAPARTRWALEHAVISAMTAGRAVIVDVVLETEDREEHLIGSALSSSGPLEEAAARAVVDAVDRRLSWLSRT